MSPESATSEPEVVVGREPEVERIQLFLARASAGGQALLLLGEAGVGKTALLNLAAASAGASGFRLVRTAGVEFEAQVNFAGLNRALVPLTDSLDLVSNAHAEALTVALGLGAGEPPDRLHVANAVLALLARLAAEQPLLLVVDDVHWLDQASSWIFMFVAQRLADNPIALLGATRFGAGSFFETGGMAELDVEPLSADAAGALLIKTFPDLAPGVRDRLLVEAEGNPLALLELPRALNDRQRSEQVSLPRTLPLSRRLNALFAGRIEKLNSSCRRILLLSVLEGTGDLKTLSRAYGDGALAALTPAEENHLVEVSLPTGTVAFRHPLMRSTIMNQATGLEVESAHRDLAAALVDQPDRRARHLAEATTGPDEAVAEELERAAHAMQGRGDLFGAVATLVRAADLSPSSGQRGRRLSEAASLGAIGGHPSIGEILDQARNAAAGLPMTPSLATAAAMTIFNGDGDLRTAHGLLNTAIRSRLDHGDPTDESFIDAIRTFGSLAYLSASPALWEPFHSAIQRLGPSLPDELRLQDEVFADPLRATPAALARLEAAIEALPGEHDQRKILSVCGAASSVDRVAGCREALWRVVSDARRGKEAGQAIAALSTLCSHNFVTGRWDEVEPVATEAIDLCQSNGRAAYEWVLRFQVARVAAGRGDTEAVRGLSEAINAWAIPRGVRLAQLAATFAREGAALGEGDFENAYQLATAITPAGVMPSHSLYALWSGLDLVEAALRTGRFPEAAAHAEAMRESGMAEVSPRLAMLSYASEALVAPMDQADDHFSAALSVSDASGWAFEHARVQVLYGEHLRRARAPVRARAYLEPALETFGRLRAVPWSERASRELRATGKVRSSARPNGIAELTTQERQIAMLAASGLTNKEIGVRMFMSHRTVSTHLYRIFPKLGITSRAALRDAIAPTDLEKLDGQPD